MGLRWPEAHELQQLAADEVRRPVVRTLAIALVVVVSVLTFLDMLDGDARGWLVGLLVVSILLAVFPVVNSIIDHHDDGDDTDEE